VIAIEFRRSRTFGEDGRRVLVEFSSHSWSNAAAEPRAKPVVDRLNPLMNAQEVVEKVLSRFASDIRGRECRDERPARRPVSDPTR
jgi:hypothetical protein